MPFDIGNLNSSFDIPFSGGNFFAQGFMPAGWDTLPSLDLPDFNAAHSPAAMDLSIPPLSSLNDTNLFTTGFFGDE